MPNTFNNSQEGELTEEQRAEQEAAENANLQAEVEPSNSDDEGSDQDPSEAPVEPVENAGNDEEAPEESEPTEPGNDDTEGDTFPREYVQKLRDENAKYRQRAQAADALAERLHVALVDASGRLADPTDLPYSDEYLEDPEKLAQAIDKLLHSKPHLASRRPRGDIGQGATRTTAPVDLLGILRQNAF